MRTHTLTLLAATAGLLAGASATARQGTNEGDAGGTGLNTGGGDRGVVRLLSAPRLDPSTAGYRDTVIHWRTAIPPAMPEDSATDFLESVSIFSLTGGFSYNELTRAPDESGIDLDTDNNAIPDVWGGAAYQWSPELATKTNINPETLDQSPYMRGTFTHTPEFNTFGGVTMNGGAALGNPRVAFFAGLIN